MSFIARDLRLSLLVAAVVGGGAAGAMALSGRAPDIKPEALSAAVQARLDDPVQTLAIAPGGDAPWGPGEPVQLWLTAGDPADLYHLPARRIGKAISLLGPLRRVRETPLAAEELVLSRADQAIVALRDGETVQVIARHTNVPQALYLTKPTRTVHAKWTRTGFAITTDSGTITVDTARGTVTPTSAGQWSAALPPPHILPIQSVGAPPPPFEHRWVAGEPLVLDAVTLTAFDSRDFALQYVPGIAYPGGVHGRPGTGVGSADAHAWLGVSRANGAAVDGRLLAPMGRSGAAIAIGATGHARIGLFAGEPVPPRNGVLRQAGVPLVLDGRPVRLSHAVTAERGLGVTKDGMIIIAKAQAMPRFEFASVLARVGVVQAVTLRSTARPSPRYEAFMVVDRRGFGGPRWLDDGWAPLHRGLAQRAAGAVTLALIAADANAAQLVPGSAEIGGAGVRPPDGGWCLTGGFRSDRAPFGLKLGAETRRTPREGVLSLLIDAKGRARLGPAAATVADETSVLQGPQLIRDGRVAIEDRRVEPGVLTAIGARTDGRLVYAHTRSDVGTLVEALLAAEVVDAIRLGDLSATDAGRIIPAADLGDAEGTALCLTATDPPPAVLPAQAIRAW